MKILEELPHVFTENADDFNKLHDYIMASEDWGKIVDFLNECEEEDYELDADDIRHILKMKFNYVRKQYRFGRKQKEVHASTDFEEANPIGVIGNTD